VDSHEVADRLEFAASILRQQVVAPRPSAQGKMALGMIPKWGVELRRGLVKNSSSGGFGTPVVTCIDLGDRRGPRRWTLDEPNGAIGVSQKKSNNVGEGEILVALVEPFTAVVATDWMVGSLLDRRVAAIRISDTAMVRRGWIMTFLRSDPFREQMLSLGGASPSFQCLRQVLMPIPQWGLDDDIDGSVQHASSAALAVADAVTAWVEWDNEFAAQLHSLPEPPLFDA